MLKENDAPFHWRVKQKLGGLSMEVRGASFSGSSPPLGGERNDGSY